MEQEMQQKLNEQKMQQQFSSSNSAFGIPRKSYIPFVPMQQEVVIESASEGTYLLDGSVDLNMDSMANSRQQRRQNQAMGNQIRNVSNNSEFRQ